MRHFEIKLRDGTDFSNLKNTTFQIHKYTLFSNETLSSILLKVFVCISHFLLGVVKICLTPGLYEDVFICMLFCVQGEHEVQVKAWPNSAV